MFCNDDESISRLPIIAVNELSLGADEMKNQINGFKQNLESRIGKSIVMNLNYLKVRQKNLYFNYF